MDVLSVPLRLKSNGEFFKVSDTSNAYKAEQIKAFMSTHKQERKVFPSFGIVDPTFDGLNASDILGEFIQFYGDEINLVKVDMVREKGALDKIDVKFS